MAQDTVTTTTVSQARINVWGPIKKQAGKIGKNIITWQWTKQLLYWLIISAGTMSECVFLIASLWFSVNANVHKFVLLFINESTTVHITELATTAYVALPECIVGLAVITTLSHVRMVMYNRKDFRAWIWSVLYGLPTSVFLGLSLYTLGQAVATTVAVTTTATATTEFTMPVEWVVIRALSGFMFAFTSLLYTQLGVPQEADRLTQKDAIIENLKAENTKQVAELKAENEKQVVELEAENAKQVAGLRTEKENIIAQLRTENARLNTLISTQKEDLQKSKIAQEELLNAVNKSSEDALQAYSQECIEWLRSGVKSALVSEITHYTGHSKRKLNNAIGRGEFRHPGRNKDLILISSLIEWLEKNLPDISKGEQDTGPNLRIVNG